MEIVIKDKVPKLIDLSSLLPSDKSVTKTIGSGPTVGNGRGKDIDPVTREMIGLDIALGTRKKDIAEIYDVSQPTVSVTEQGKKYGQGKVDEELRSKINQTKFKIQDTAVSKLMDTLNLFEPAGLENQMEVVNAASKLSGIVEKLSDKQKESGPQVQVVLYSPRQNKEMEYEVIEA